MRLKYHYFNGPKKENYLGIFLSVFGWSNFSITIIETCPRADLINLENWYLSRYKPILNILTSSTKFPIVSTSLSPFTRSKISANLTGRVDYKTTKEKKSKARKGALNPFYKKGPGK